MNLAEGAERYHKYRVVPLLLGIFLIGFAIRYLAAGPRIGPELDCWFHYRIVNYILDLGHVPEIDPMAYYPTGRPVWKIDLLGLPYFIAYTYRLISFTGITVMDYMVAFPAIFTSLAAVPLYLLTKELLDEKTGLLSALLWQIIPSTLTRTHAGFVDKESLASLYIFLWLWLFIRSLKTADIKNKRTLTTPALAGVFMGLGAWTWGGTSYFMLVVTTSTVLYTLFNIKNLSESFGPTFIFMTLFGAVTMRLVQAPHFPFRLYYSPNTTYMPLTALALLYGLVIIHNRLSLKVGGKKSGNIIAFILILIIGGTGITGYLQRFISGITGFIKSRVFLEKSLIAATVSENMSPNFYGGGNNVIQRIMSGDWYSHFNIVLFLAPIGLLFLLYRFKEKKDFTSAFLIVFAVSGVLGMRSDIRLGFVLTPSLAILAAYSVFNVSGHFQRRERELKDILKRSKKQKARYKAETALSNTKMTKLLVLVILFGLVASPTVASFSMLNGRKVDVPTPWYNAMIWIRDNTPEDAVIVSWWDYGYWEQALAKRRTVVDGGNGGPLVYDTNYTVGLEYRGDTWHRDVDMAKMFTSPEDEALKYLRPYVDYEKVPTYVLVSYEEFGKSGAINHIAQDGLYIIPQGIQKSGDDEADGKAIMDFINNNGIEAYAIINFDNYWQVWFTGFDPNTRLPDPEMKNKLLPKLLPFQNTGFGQGLRHFELVYNDPWNYVLIYKVV